MIRTVTQNARLVLKGWSITTKSLSRNLNGRRKSEIDDGVILYTSNHLGLNLESEMVYERCVIMFTPQHSRPLLLLVFSVDLGWN